MTERQRTARPEVGDSDTGPEEDTSRADMRTLADQLMANAQASMRRLGLDNASDFLNATRQSGGQ
jgi:hypothetical protein